MDRPPTIRTLAKELRLAPTTVSDALRGKGRVDPATAERVRAAAAARGYRLNPLVSSVMADMRRSQATVFQGTLAAFDIVEPDCPPHGPFPRQILAGAAERAREYGFQIEEFKVGPHGLPYPRVQQILDSRGIRGILILPAWNPPDLRALPWERYAGLYSDCVITEPALHAVCPDHYRSMHDLLERLWVRGYRRPGLVLEKGRDERLNLRQSAAFKAFIEGRTAELPVPLLHSEGYQERTFLPWFLRHQPDVVLCHSDRVLDWLHGIGLRVPEQVGFVCLNTLVRHHPEASGIDLQPTTIGARAAELLIGQLSRNELGPPPWPTTTTVHAQWVEGKTLRANELAAI